MALVYSQQRAGKPAWAIFGAAVLLGLTVALAYAVILHKDHIHRVEFAATKPFPAGHLHARLPKGWKPLEELPAGVLAGLKQTFPDRPPRTLYLFRGPAVGDLAPRARSLEAVLNLVSEGYPEMDPHARELEASRFGPYPAWDIQLLLIEEVVLEGMEDYEGEIPFTDLLPSILSYEHLLAKVICLPNGESVGLALQTEDPAQRRESMILDQMASHLDLHIMSAAADTSAIMQQVGVRFDLPENARLIGPPDDQIPQMHLMVGEGVRYWDATLTRIPLIGDRRPEDIVRDILMDESMEIEPTADITVKREGERELAYVDLTVEDKSDLGSSFAYCVATGSQTALLLRTRAEPDAVNRMSRACEKMAFQAEVDSIASWLDVPSALDEGLAVLDRLRGDRLEEMLNPWNGKSRLFSIYDPGGAFRGIQSYRYRLTEENDTSEEQGHWWEITFHTERQYGEGNIQGDATTFLRSDVRAHRTSLHSKGTGIDAIQYTERARGDEDVECELDIKDKGTRESTFAPSESYLNDFALDFVYEEIGRTESMRPLILTSSGPFTEGEVPWILIPLGERQLPWPTEDGSPMTGWAVRAFQDYDPAYLEAYYGDDGEWLGAAFHQGRWFQAGRPFQGGVLKELLKRWSGNGEKESTRD